jgi:hypothetical protein
MSTRPMCKRLCRPYDTTNGEGNVSPRRSRPTRPTLLLRNFVKVRFQPHGTLLCGVPPPDTGTVKRHGGGGGDTARFVARMRTGESLSPERRSMLEEARGVVTRGGSAWNVIRFRRGHDARSIPPIRIPGEQGRDRSVLIGIAAEVMRKEYQRPYLPSINSPNNSRTFSFAASSVRCPSGVVR